MHEPVYKSDLSVNEKVLMGIVRTAEIFKRSHSAVFRNYGLSFPINCSCHITGAKTIVDIDDRHIRAAAVEHGKEGCQST